MKIYTRAGDDGLTALIGGRRVSKADVRIAAYGDVDALNAMLGVCRACSPPSDIDLVLEGLQHELFAVGAELAAPDAAARNLEAISASHVLRLENQIDSFDGELPVLKEFILPTGAALAASLHSARCACRGAERSVVALSECAALRPALLHYLNRVSDLLFVLARVANRRAGIADEAWKKPQ